MNVSKISGCSFKGVYLSNALEPGKQYDLGVKIRDFLNQSGIGDSYERKDKDILVKKGKNGGINIVPVRYSIKRILDDNYSRWNGRIN